MPDRYTLTNACVLLADAELVPGVVPIAGDRIGASADGPNVDLRHLNVAPGFVDLQVNGGGNRLFNDTPDETTLGVIVEAHARFGTTSLLPVFMTGPQSGMRAAIGAVARYRRSGRPGIEGIHFEGPLFSPEKLGIHTPLHRSDDFPLSLLREEVPTLITFAPEVASARQLAQLHKPGVRLACGHSNATAREADNAINAGVLLATHLFNAMSQLGSREPGVTGAYLANDNAWVNFICDGHHVDYRSLRVAWRAKPTGRAFLVTDAMPPVGGEPRDFQLGDSAIKVDNGCCRDAAGVLAGSALDMASAVRNCVTYLGVPLAEALRMASTYPARYFGIDNEVGAIAPGLRANLVIFDDDVNVQGIVRDGTLTWFE